MLRWLKASWDQSHNNSNNIVSSEIGDCGRIRLTVHTTNSWNISKFFFSWIAELIASCFTSSAWHSKYFKTWPYLAVPTFISQYSPLCSLHSARYDHPQSPGFARLILPFGTLLLSFPSSVSFFFFFLSLQFNTDIKPRAQLGSSATSGLLYTLS